MVGDAETFWESAHMAKLPKIRGRGVPHRSTSRQNVIKETCHYWHKAIRIHALAFKRAYKRLITILSKTAKRLDYKFKRHVTIGIKPFGSKP